MEQQKALSFKEKYTFEQRIAESKTKREANPKLYPVVVEKHHRSKLPDLEKAKFLVSGDLKFYEFQASIKNKLKLADKEALYFFTAAKKIDGPNAIMSEIYDKNKDEDGFLYLTFAELETFGGSK